jgi:hypothetical protein
MVYVPAWLLGLCLLGVAGCGNEANSTGAAKESPPEVTVNNSCTINGQPCPPGTCTVNGQPC